MGEYVLNRIASLVPVLVGISIAVFLLVRLIPGDVIDILLGPETILSVEARQVLEQQLGLDVPIHLQYARWLWQLLHGNMGNSLRTGQPVAETILFYLPRTVELAMLSVLLSVVFAVPLGVISAVQRNNVIDLLVRLTGTIGLSIPEFWLATMLILICSKGFRWMPPLIFVSPFESPVENLQQLALPSISLALIFTAMIMRMTRSALLEVLTQDYIITARAKGLKEAAVVLRHALKNAFIPVVTLVGMQMGYLLGGAVIIEQVFSLPGIGWVLLNSVYQRDYPVIQGTVLVLGLMFVTVNLAVDISYAYLDPRIRH